jgi:lysophospholipase L1-like esterase
MRPTARCTFVVDAQTAPMLLRTSLVAFGNSVTRARSPCRCPRCSRRTARFSGCRLVPETSYPEQQRRLLAARSVLQAESIVVVNAGLTGEAAVDAVARLPRVPSSTQPDVVLLLDGYNDVTILGLTGARRAAEPCEPWVRRRACVAHASSSPR